MGKGDKKTKRGKITISSYGKTRPHKVAAPVIAESDKKKTGAKKTAATKKS
ncbi:MAG: 30S ribosomal protein THX [Saprospiraceae bacterium]|nr:30S ribosomal protein THX [Saprospiraceae bacterium]